MAIKHVKVVTTADDGTSEVGTDEWNDNHTIEDNTITNDHLTGSIAQSKITNLTTDLSSITSDVTANTAKISLTDNSVTLAKLAHGTADKYLGFDGSGIPAELTVSGIPSGCIVMWSGALVSIPTGWYLCDGNNSTPNLSNKFIRSGSGVGSTGGSDTVSLTTAQLASHTHTQSAHTHTQSAHTHTQDAHTHTQDAHGHSGSTNTTGSHYHLYPNGNGPSMGGAGSSPWGSPSNQTTSAGSHSHTVTVSNATAVNQSTTAINSSTTATNSSTTAVNSNTGSGSSHENMPSYYTLAYIMKA